MQEYGRSRAAFDRDCTGFVDTFRDPASKVSVGRVIQNAVAMEPWDRLQAPIPPIRVVEIKQNGERIAVCER